jgi:replication factor C small subunit
MALDDMWVEKYRPKTLDDVVGQDEIINRLKHYAKEKNLPHLMFTGVAGIGKTSCAVALAREMFGDEWRYNFMELNASDDRGINVVRGEIKDFAKSSVMGNAEFKLLFLDEADALTPDAQAALRRTMESYTKVCRFILSCNYSSKIIEPIQSRCAVYRFKQVSNIDIQKRIRYIAEKEGLKITADAVNAIIYIAQGDMRKAINALQGSAIISKEIDSNIIYKTSSVARPEDIRDLLMLSLEGKFSKARVKLEYLTIDQGVSADEIVKQIYYEIFNMSISDEMKVDLIDQVGEIDFRLTEGANERIQLDVLISRLIMYGINSAR